MVEIPIKVTEIDVKYKEMDNNSIRDILHGLTAEKGKYPNDKCAKELLIRHVCDEWTLNQNKRRYSVAVFGDLVEETVTVIKYLSESLLMRYPEAASIISRVFNSRSEVKNDPQRMLVNLTKQKNKDNGWFDNNDEERYNNVQIVGLELVRQEDLPTNRQDKGASTVGESDFTNDGTLTTIQSSDKTADTTAGDSKEVEKFAKQQMIKVELVRRKLGQIKAKLIYINEFKDKKEELDTILNMQDKRYDDILGTSPLYWSSKTIANQILGKFRKILGLDPGEGPQ